MKAGVPLVALLLASYVLLLPASALARTATAAEKAACEAKIQPRLDSIDARLRTGYSAKEGERLRAERRKLQTKKTACRKVP